MSYIKTDTFVDIAIECDQDPKKVIDYIQQNISPNYAANVTQVRNRINNYKRKGLLPLSSGNTVDSGQFLKGTSTLYDANGNIKQQWVKTDSAKENALEAFEHLISNLANTIPPLPVVRSPLPDQLDDLLTLYPIGDAHIGMLSHAEETGDNHDLSICRANHTKAIKLAVDQALPSKEAFIIDCGDFLHADDSSNTTPRGNNPLDVDGRFHKVLDVACSIAETMILTALTKHTKVYWRSAHGNHNPHTSVMISKYLQGRFKNYDNVVIFHSPAMYFYHQFGKNLLGITHGHTCKPDKLGELMAVDCNDIWSTTEHRYWILGHVHHTQVKEYPSCVVETFRTLTPKDAWHASMAYRSKQDMKVITLHKEYGEVARNSVSIALVNDIKETPTTDK